MSRSAETKSRIAGFVEHLKDSTTGAEVVIDLKEEFGPVFEEYMRENQWLKLIDMLWNDQQRTVYKTTYKEIRDSMADFDPTTKAKGGSIKPELVIIRQEETKDVAAEYYEKDFEQSNGLETVGNKIIEELFKVPDEVIDETVVAKFIEAAGNNALVTSPVIDIDSMEINAENGKIVFELIKSTLEVFRKSGSANAYNRGSRIPKEFTRIAISPKVEELLTSYKSAFIDQSGLLNTGVFGSTFRNVWMQTMEEMPEDTYPILFFTPRAIMGVVELARHTKLVPEAINQNSYMTEANNVFGWGFKRVFEDEVLGIEQGTVAPADVKKAKLTQVALDLIKLLKDKKDPKNSEELEATNKKIKELQIKIEKDRSESKSAEANESSIDPAKAEAAIAEAEARVAAAEKAAADYEAAMAKIEADKKAEIEALEAKVAESEAKAKQLAAEAKRAEAIAKKSKSNKPN